MDERADMRLTKHRKKTLLFYLHREQERERVPTFTDVMVLHGWKQVATAREHLEALETHGLLEQVYIRFDPRENRRSQARGLSPLGRKIAVQLGREAMDRSK